MTNLTYDNFATQLRQDVPGFADVYDEHVADNDEVLPHVLLADLVRFLSKEVDLHGAKSVALTRAMSLLEAGIGSPDPLLQELVAVSFVENLDPEEESFSTIRTLFGPALEEQYLEFENFDPYAASE